MPTKKERLDALEADMRTLREELDGTARAVENLSQRDGAPVDAINRELGENFRRITERIDGVIENHFRQVRGINERHDQAMEIVGTRIGELAVRLDRIENPEGHRTAAPVMPFGGFPTGAATTVDDALAAVPPVDDSPPRRGDRVRLEGARTAYLLKAVPDGWYDVIGWSETVDNPSFQIAADSAGWVPFIRDNSPALKEVRRKVVAPTPRSPIEPEDGLDV